MLLGLSSGGFASWSGTGLARVPFALEGREPTRAALGSGRGRLGNAGGNTLVARLLSDEDRRLCEAGSRRDIGAKRIDPATNRLDRSGEGALNATDLNAVEEALRIKEAQGGEVVVVSFGPDEGTGLAAQGTRDGCRSRRPRLGRRSCRLGSRRDELCAREGARARESRPRAVRAAVLGLGRCRALGGRRRAAAQPARLAGRRSRSSRP